MAILSVEQVSPKEEIKMTEQERINATRINNLENTFNVFMQEMKDFKEEMKYDRFVELRGK